MAWWELIGRIAEIIVINVVLSGDNAVVIGMAARRLPPVQRRKAIIYGGAAAVALRILFTALAALLLGIPLLQAGGGLLLVWIAIGLLRSDDGEADRVCQARNMRDAVRTIVLADVITSLDNILAVGGESQGHIGLLLFGLAVSIPLVLLGAELVASLMNRLTWLVWLGAGTLAWTAGQMIAADRLVGPYLAGVPDLTSALPAAVVLLVAVMALLVNHTQPKESPR